MPRNGWMVYLRLKSGDHIEVAYFNMWDIAYQFCIMHEWVYDLFITPTNTEGVANYN
jgi:hypothetical protein